VKKHGYQAISHFKRGLNRLRSTIRYIWKIPREIMDFLVSLFQPTDPENTVA
jgi:hypothetical protein